MKTVICCFAMRIRQLVGIGLLGLFIACSIQPTYAADPPLPTPVGRVIWVQGTLKAIMPNQEERLLKKMSVIYLKDTLLTDSTSKAQIAFTDNTLMTFRPDTKFYIDTYQYNAKAKGSAGKYIMNLIEGGFRTITGLIAKQNPSDYKVNTPVATIGVRGTDYTVYLDKAGQLFMGSYTGVPCVTNSGGNMCLSDKIRYAQVRSAAVAPVPLTQPPAVLVEKLNVIPATITPFASGTTGVTPVPSRPLTGTFSSFCITQ